MSASVTGSLLPSPTPQQASRPARATEAFANLPFSKYHGLGNDFIVLDLRSSAPLAAWPNTRWAAIAREACNRRTGVGADGLLLITQPPPGIDAACHMHVVNSDGTDGGMCGNGIRCIAHLLLARGSAPRSGSLRVLAGGSVRTVALVGECTPHAARVRVEMGSAAVHARRVAPHALLPELAPEILLACGPATTCSTVDVGNPHIVLHCEQLPTDAALTHLGPRIEHHRAFPHRTNVQFALAETTATGSGFQRVRTWERGSGITQACGTGACAVAASLAGSAPASLDVALPGGMLTIDTGIASSGGEAIVPDLCMTGPAAFVFEGVLPILHVAIAP